MPGVLVYTWWTVKDAASGGLVWRVTDRLCRHTECVALYRGHMLTGVESGGRRGRVPQ